ALRRINEACGVPCTVLGRQGVFAEEHQRDCAGPWRRRLVRLSVKAGHLLTRNYVAEGPTAVFLAAAHPRPRRPTPSRADDNRPRARRPSPDACPPYPG